MNIHSLVNRNMDKGISVKEYKVNSPSLYKCMQVTPVNTNKTVPWCSY